MKEYTDLNSFVRSFYKCNLTYFASFFIGFNTPNNGNLVLKYTCDHILVDYTLCGPFHQYKKSNFKNYIVKIEDVVYCVNLLPMRQSFCISFEII